MKIDIVMHWKKQCIGVATVIAVLVSPIVAFGDTPAANCPQLTTCPAADLLTIPGSTCTNLCTTYTNGTNVVNGTYECVQGPTVCAKWTPPADCPQLTTCPPEVLNTTPGFTCDSKCTTFTNGKNIVNGIYECVQGSTVCIKWKPPADCPQLTACPPADLITTPGSTCQNMCTTFTNGKNIVHGAYDCVQGSTVCTKWIPPADCPQLTVCPPAELITTPGSTCENMCTTYTNGTNIVNGAYDCVQGSTVCTKWIPPTN